jgi:hypothetical protein
MSSARSVHPLQHPGVAFFFAALALVASLSLARPTRAQDSGWPREFESESGTLVVYQPQPEELHGDVLSGRAAFSLKRGDTTPAFGVLWFTEQIEVDRDSSTVTARRLDVTKVRLPGITAEEAGRYEELVESQSTSWDLSGSVEELQAGLAAAEHERESVAGLDNAPPRILFHERRAILVVYDGAPALETIEGSDLERVVNTPYAVVFDPGERSYYLNGANLWYRASNPLGPWTSIRRPPAAIRDAVPPDTTASDQVSGPPPEVLTAAEPTELIATDGPPRYATLVRDELLYITNTESDVVLEVDTQSLYVLISGRWFRAPSTDGPWTFVRSDHLPSAFKRVPADGPKGHILASVAGTEQAEDALADAQIPQTSAIRRDGASFQVVYDGEPQFEDIEGTDLEYAVNTDAEVILADDRYYACDQGVWYIADDPEGPWMVSETRPVGVEDIPPSCPVYDVRYVYVYDATPEVVYVGYLPGYLGCYPYYGTVVYGTGYRYHAWRGRRHYYPHRFTWGFHARYNPWLSRWSFGFSYGSGFLRVGTRWRWGHKNAHVRARSLWFGPGGYRRPFIAPDRTFLRTRRTRTRVADALPANVYNRQENVARVDRTRVRSVVAPIPRPMPVPNDVFAGQDGKVYRREARGKWQVRTGTKWKPTKLPLPTPAPTRGRADVPAPPQRPPVARPDVPTPRPEPRIATPDEPAPRPKPPIERPERPEPRRERPLPREERRERPEPRVQQPAPRPERPEPRVERERPAPPPEKPEPGDLEKEFRARQRSEESEKEKEKSRKEERKEERSKDQRDRQDRSNEERGPRSGRGR